MQDMKKSGQENDGQQHTKEKKQINLQQKLKLEHYTTNLTKKTNVHKECA